jgi:hypothetical protein
LNRKTPQPHVWLAAAKKVAQDAGGGDVRLMRGVPAAWATPTAADTQPAGSKATQHMSAGNRSRSMQYLMGPDT